MSVSGTIYGVGVGPGDPELLTLKAARLIGTVPVIAVPVTKPGGQSYALEIVRDFLRPDQKIIELHFPMVRETATRIQHRQAAAQIIAEELRAGNSVAFLTEGDPLLHSTFGYVLRYLPEGLPVTVIPGVSSILAAAAETQIPLVNADQRLAIIPATFEEIEKLHSVFHDFDTVVLLKISRVFDRVLAVLDELGLTDKAVLIERASHSQGRVVHDVSSLRGEATHYLSLLIVHTGGGSDEG
jgi:precorrin-2/cobalt-factor-2 C20-methyltransferase